MFETIVALATAPLKSALGIIRISGDDCFEIVSKCFSKNITDIKERTVLFGHVMDGENKIDDVVAIIYKGPKSFTGENLVEIICHGSPLIENQIIEKLISCGARMATNGEYSSRAFLHQKIDLVQAEAINDVINAATKEAKNLSLLSLDGKVSVKVYPIKKKLGDIISLIEVNIDFPEYEDIEVANKDLIIKSCDEIISDINTLISDAKIAQIIKDGINVAIVGKPNVGKSSILNCLMGEEKAIVTDVAGTTRDVVEGEINLKGLMLHLLDTAGIHDSKDKVESIGINRSKEAIEKADLVIVVLDASSALTEEDNEVLELTKDKKRIVVYNKADKNNLQDKLVVSALNNQVKPLIDEIYKSVGLSEESFKTPALNNARQLGLLVNAKNALLKAQQDAKSDLTVDLLSVSLMDAYNAILEILGENNQIDLSKEIFSRFCVGK